MSTILILRYMTFIQYAWKKEKSKNFFFFNCFPFRKHTVLSQDKYNVRKEYHVTLCW